MSPATTPDHPAFTELVRRPLYLQVAAQLREAIYDGRFAPGEPLPAERELAELIGASRPSVREALRALEAEGLIVTGGTPARATVTKELDRPAREALVNLLRLRRVALGELVELRCLLETAAVRWAARRPGCAPLEEAGEALTAMRAATGDLEAFDEADLRFHVALARASGNEAMHLLMLALRDPVSDQLRATFARQPDLARTLERVIAEHAAILEAVRVGDGDGAAALIERHIRDVYRAAEVGAGAGTEAGAGAGTEAEASPTPRTPQNRKRSP